MSMMGKRAMVRGVMVLGLSLFWLVSPAAVGATDGSRGDAPATQPAATSEATAAEAAGGDGGAQGDRVGWLKLSRPLREGPVPFAWVNEKDARPSLGGVLDQLETVAESDRYRGVVLKLEQPRLNLSQIAAIHEAMWDLRQSGKKVLAFAQGYDLRSYLLASAAEQIVLQRGGSVKLAGLGMEEMYVAGLLEKIGVEADLLQIGKYKGARESLTRGGPSEAWNENINGLLDGLYGHILETLATNRDVSEAKMESLMRESWSLDAAGCLDAGLVDRVASRDFISVSEAVFGNDFTWDQTMGRETSSRQASGPFALFRMLMQKPDTQTSQPTIAVLYGHGPIVTGKSARGQGLFGSRTIGSETMIEALDRIRRDDNIKGAVVRIDSPGGSAVASEVIWQALRQAAEEKPVFVSLGSTAASGAYYIASAGDRLFATAPTIVGSIGVVGGKLAMGGLYEKLGVSVTQRTRGPMAGLFNSADRFTEDQREAIRASLQQVYDQFLDRVRQGRGSRIDDIEQVAKGRIFTGRQASQNGLVDTVGGLEQTITAVADRSGVKEGEYELLRLPAPMSLESFLNDTLGGEAQASHAGTLQRTIAGVKRALGEKRWQAVAPVLTGLMQLRDERALTLMPAALVLN